MRRLLTAPLLVAALIVPASARATTLTVSSTADTSTAGTLRYAITQANLSPAVDTITFTAGAAGVIALGSALPSLTAPVSIQVPALGPGGLPLVQVDCNGHPFTGLDIAAGVPATVVGLSITRCATGIAVRAGSSLTLKSSRIGIDLAGATLTGSTYGIYSDGSASLLLGSAATADGNVIAGAATQILATHLGDGTIQNNYIGTALGGSAGAGDATGVQLDGTGQITIADNVIAGATDPAAADLVLNQDPARDVTQPGIQVLRNRLGTSADGDTAITIAAPNLRDRSVRSLVQGNIAAGVAGGLYLQGGPSVVQSNQVCLNSGGTEGLAASGSGTGILVQTSKPDTVVGGEVAGQANIVSGCTGSGMTISAPTTQVAGNIVGLARDGVTPIGNGVAGIVVTAAGSGSTIGGATGGTANVVSGNDAVGVLLAGAAGHVEVRGNRIGSSADGTQVVPNATGGVAFDVLPGSGADAPAGNTVEQNQIWMGASPGVAVRAAGAIGNALLGNVIRGTGQAIDLFPAGPTPNDAGDPDTGPNGLQNAPVISAAGAKSLTSSINTTPKTAVRIQVFTSSADGRAALSLVGESTATTDETGNAIVAIGANVPVGTPLVETATTADGTSELSAPVLVAAATSSSAPAALLPVVKPVTAPDLGFQPAPVVVPTPVLGLTFSKFGTDGRHIALTVKNTAKTTAVVKVGGTDGSATAKTKGAGKALKAVRKTIRAGRSATFVLTVPKTTRAKLKQALKTHKAVKYRPTIVVTNLSTTARLSYPATFKLTR